MTTINQKQIQLTFFRLNNTNSALRSASFAMCPLTSKPDTTNASAGSSVFPMLTVTTYSDFSKYQLQMCKAEIHTDQFASGIAARE